MATILVYNNNDGGIERYHRAPSDPMPYNVGGTLTVSEFLGGNDFGWTDFATMQAWNQFRSFIDAPVHLDLGFVRMSQLGPNRMVALPQHLMGTAFASGSNLSAPGRESLYSAADESDAFSVVIPFSLGDQTVYFDKRYMPSGAFVTSGLPTLRRGSRGNQVMTAQDILNTAGYSAGTVDGIFGQNTERALRAFQHDRLLTENGIIGRMTWESLLNLRVAIV